VDAGFFSNEGFMQKRDLRLAKVERSVAVDDAIARGVDVPVSDRLRWFYHDPVDGYPLGRLLSFDMYSTLETKRGPRHVSVMDEKGYREVSSAEALEISRRMIADADGKNDERKQKRV
jgi:hypothetical protein